MNIKDLMKENDEIIEVKSILEHFMGSCSIQTFIWLIWRTYCRNKYWQWTGKVGHYAIFHPKMKANTLRSEGFP